MLIFPVLYDFSQMEILPEQRAPELVQACRDNDTAFALVRASMVDWISG